MWKPRREPAEQGAVQRLPLGGSAAGPHAGPRHPCAPVPPPAQRLVPSPRPPRGVAEVRDAIRAAEVLRDLLNLERGEALLGLLAPYRRRLLLPAVDAGLGQLGEKPSTRLHAAAMRVAGPVLLDAILPACRDHILDRLLRADLIQESEGLPSVVGVATAMRVLVANLRGAGRQHLLEVISRVERDSGAMAERAARAESAASTLAKDSISRMSHMLLRLEGLRLVLEALGARNATLYEVSYQSRRVARLGLRLAAGALNAYIVTPDLITLRDSMMVINAIDSLLVVALRILDALEGREEEATAFVKRADEVVLDDYVDAATRLTRALFGLVDKAVARPDLDDLLFAAMIRKIKWMYRFCARLDHALRPAALDELTDFIVLRSAMQARRVGELLADALLAHPPRLTLARHLLVRAEEIAGLLPEMNRKHVRDALIVRIAAARDTLADRRAQGATAN